MAFGYAVYGLGVVVGLRPAFALLIAFVIGVLFNFLTTGRLVFSQSGASLLPKFLAVYGAVYGVNVLALNALLAWGMSALVAQLVLQPLSAVLAYLLMSRLVFVGSPRA